jgi:hypothetical protein
MLKNQHLTIEVLFVFFLSDYFSKQRESNNFCDEEGDSFLGSWDHFGRILKSIFFGTTAPSGPGPPHSRSF